MVSMNELLHLMVERGASDLHITAGTPPQLRIDGSLVPTNYDVLTPEMSQQLAYSILKDSQKKRFESSGELDLSFSVKRLSRFRANIFRQRGCVAAAIRTIPFEILSFEELSLPPVVQNFSNKRRGLVLVTGPTGSGKSTTLAAIIDKINRERSDHIITIEDPIEYIHHHKMGIVNQREVNDDTQSFTAALKYCLRQDPDVILIGEMRDLETIGAALTIAETGHLVFATLHTNDCAQSINRIIDVFPPHQQPQIRAQLALILEGVLSQQLIPKSSGRGRVLSLEVLVPTFGVRSLIREDKVHQIYSSMQTGTKFGMQTMNQSLLVLVQRGLISYEVAMTRTSNPEEFKQLFQKTAVRR